MTVRIRQKESTLPEQRKGISGSTLKLLAVFAMLADHIGAVVLEPLILASGSKYSSMMFAGWNILQWDQCLRLYVGRIAFPIFCFLLVEGFTKTSNQYRYALRLLIFAFLSEVPFDLALKGSVWYADYQNVFFTLFIGLLVMLCMSRADRILKDRIVQQDKAWLYGTGVFVARSVLLLAGMGMAQVLSTDYGAYGVMCIVVLYLCRRDRRAQLVVSAFAFVLGDMIMNGSSAELLAPLGLWAAFYYNGRRGLRLKYSFYLFYPLHLLILYCVRMVLVG